MSIIDTHNARFPEIEKESAFKAIQQSKQNELLRETEKLRGSILDSAQLFFGEHPNWKPFRARVLTLLGKRGFEKSILETFEKPFLIGGKGEL